MKESYIIAGRIIGREAPPFIIAELSGNHRGDLSRALDLIVAAKEAGADAIKLQTYTADTLTINHDGPDFLIQGGLWHGHRLYDLYRQAATPWEWHEALFAKAAELGIIAFSTPFDETAVDFLEKLGAPAYKVASFEMTDLPLVQKIASTGKPAIISTGLANLGEIADTVRTWRSHSAAPLCLLHCVSAYPAPAEEANLRTIPHLAAAFDVIAGLSDHTLGISVAIASVALGACVIEKHITLDRSEGGPDAAFSLEPRELKFLVEGCKTAYAALGRVNYDVSNSERANLTFRRSLYAVADIQAGELLTMSNVRSIRPGFGLAPRHLPEVLGKRAKLEIKRGTPLDWSLFRD